MTKLKLLCYFPAEEPCFITINIEADAYVNELSKAIHEELKILDQDVRLKDIRLYKTDVPVEPNENLANRALQWLHEQQYQAHLHPTAELVTLFPNVPRPSVRRLDIIITNDEVLELLENLAEPDARYMRRVRKTLGKCIDGLSSGPSPSETVKSAKTVETFLDGEKCQVSLGRVPAAIFSPPLAMLQQRLGDLEKVEVTRADVNRAYAFFGKAVAFFDDEAQREKHSKRFIDDAVGVPGEWQGILDWANNIKPDACWWHEVFLMIVLELKNMLGIGGDAVIQAMVDYSKILSGERYAAFRSTCNFPVVLVGMTMSRLEVSVAVCAGSIYVSRLLILDLSSGFHGSEIAIQTARVFKALSLCRTDLRAYYDGVAAHKYPMLSCLYPNPTSSTGVTLPLLTYRKFMARTGQPTSVIPDLGNRTTAMYIATLTETNQEVVVKFTARYNEQAHRLLADAGLAPKLHFCERVVGNLFMVIMEYVKGKSIWELREANTAIAAIVPKKVEEAISLLHGKDIVFGDLRDSNVLCVQSDDFAEGGVFLVDFDWANIEGEGKYPVTININNPWEQGVSPYGDMLKEHDLWQLRRLKQLCR